MRHTERRATLKPTRVVLFSLLPAALLLSAGEGICRLLGLPTEPSRLVVRVGFDGCYFEENGDAEVTLCEPAGAPGDRVSFATRKRPGTCRVAFLGGSSVRIPGSPIRPWPDRAGDLVPRIEVLNLGVPGANSAATTLRGLEAARYDVDLFVAYAGHNDVAQGVYSGLSDPAVAASLRGIRLRLLLNRSALYRTILSIVSPLSPIRRTGDTGVATRTTPLYSEQDRQTLADVLRDNLARLVDGVAPKPVILLVPVSNPHWNPTGTLIPEDPSEAEHLTRELDAARAAIEQGRTREAAERLDAVLQQYPDSAFGWWLKAQALSRRGKAQDAARAAAMARDLDALPMRATTEVEAAVRGAKAYAVVDLPARLPRVNGLLRADLFMDAIHFSETGHALVARLVAPLIARACGAERPNSDPPSLPPPPGPRSRPAPGR